MRTSAENGRGGRWSGEPEGCDGLSADGVDEHLRVDRCVAREGRTEDWAVGPRERAAASHNRTAWREEAETRRQQPRRRPNQATARARAAGARQAVATAERRRCRRIRRRKQPARCAHAAARLDGDAAAECAQDDDRGGERRVSEERGDSGRADGAGQVSPAQAAQRGRTARQASEAAPAGEEAATDADEELAPSRRGHCTEGA